MFAARLGKKARRGIIWTHYSFKTHFLSLPPSPFPAANIRAFNLRRQFPFSLFSFLFLVCVVMQVAGSRRRRKWGKLIKDSRPSRETKRKGNFLPSPLDRLATEGIRVETLELDRRRCLLLDYPSLNRKRMEFADCFPYISLNMGKFDHPIQATKLPSKYLILLFPFD